MKKKISILTFFFSHNYGAVLQAYAMSNLLINEGYEVEFIDLKTHSANIKPTFPKSVRDIFILYKFVSIKRFIKKHFPSVTKPIRSLTELNNYNFNSDLFLVGSDQVWGLNHTGKSYEAFFLNFVPDKIPKIAFAASFGVSEWGSEVNSKITDNVKSLLERFNYIGVREESGVDICTNVFNVQSKHVLDPTLLLGNFDQLIGDVKQKSHKTLFRYFIHQNIILNKEVDIITNLISKHSKIKKWNNIKYIKYKNPAQWLRTIASSEFIITDSFHVCCFSIMFRKPFLVYITKKSVSTRITSLLNELGLANRIVYNSNELNLNESWQLPIDFDKVYTKLEKMRLESFNELKMALSYIK